MATITLYDRLARYIRNRHLLAADVVLLVLAVWLSFALRLDAEGLQPYVRTMLIYALAAPCIQLPIFGGLGVYSRLWQHASVDELLLLIGATLLGNLTQGALFLGGQIFLPGLLQPPVPRSIPLLATIVILAFIAAPRFALRIGTQRARRLARLERMPASQQRVLIAGAGEAGALIARELHANPHTGLVPVGFVDDDPMKHGMLLHRLRVFGGRERIPQLVREHHVDQVIIAMPSAAGEEVRDIVSICEAAGVETRILPGMPALLSGQIGIQHIRQVQIEDLLRRAPVRIDLASVAGLVQGKRVLVTGAGGSIGTELCRQLLRFQPAELILLGHGENSIFEIHAELRSAIAKIQTKPGSHTLATVLQPVIADIRFPERLAAVFNQHRPQIVFHAAAHKHVPLMEENIADAVSNNIVGTQRLVDAASAAGTTHFVLISTDKAVNPTSVMGATKRVAELIVQEAAQRTGRAFVVVRFGNVLGSRGSVVPIFQRQIAAGGPITVTHPEVRRYFMTIPEAVQLVLQAAALGRGGEIFVLDMGEPIRIADLAADLVRLSGLELGRDITIEYTGLRPGEKLYEELFGATEAYDRTSHEKIFVCRNGAEGRNLTQTERAGNEGLNLSAQIAALIAAANQDNVEDFRRQLRRLVPEYRPADQELAG